MKSINKFLTTATAALCLSLAFISCSGSNSIDNLGERIPVTGVVLGFTGERMDLNVGQSRTLNPRVEPEKATDKALTWSTSDRTRATVDDNGRVTAVAVGTAVITAVSKSNSNAMAQCEVRVDTGIVNVTGVSINRTTLELKTGETGRLTHTISPANATNTSVQWTSDNTDTATVNSDGLVTAVAVGKTNITVTTQDGGFQARCEVTVEANVYVAGSFGLMKNGVLQPGYENSRCYSVFVSGGDVYVAGFNYSFATVWKNGVAQHYSLSGGTRSATIRSVFVSGGDVYAAGSESNSSNSWAKLWKNGVEQRLNFTNGYSWAESVFVSGNDVYVGGLGTDGQDSDYVIWKNGVVHYRNVGTSIFVDGNNVYTAGGGDAYKNGERLFLNSSGFSSHATDSIFVSGGDVYVGGWVYDAQDRRYVVFWKNGVLQLLSSRGNYWAQDIFVFVFGSDVYVSGWERNGNTDTAKLWKNGVEQVLGNGDAYSVFVK